MRCLALTLLVVAGLTVGPAHANMISDMFNEIMGLFQTKEEAPYTVVTSENGYQEREYPARKWLCKTVTNNPRAGQDLSIMFWPLFNYISGHNRRNEKYQMTVPVTTKYTVRSASEKKYEMCFFISEEHQDDPAQPNPDTGVFIQERPLMRVLTRTVGGYVTNEQEWEDEAGLLAGVLEQNGITVTLDKTYWVGYDSPMKFWSRRNEVWFPIDD